MKRILVLVMALVLLLLPTTSLAARFVPERAIAYMNGKFDCGCTLAGSGTMIGRYGLITAGSNLYCYQHGKPMSYINFHFGAKSANSCWYKYSGRFTYWAYDKFENGYSSVNDIGWVIFDAPVGNETGWFASRAASDSYLNEEFVNVMSYDYKWHMQSVFSVMYVRDSKRVYWDGWKSGTEGGPVYFWQEGMEFPEVVAVYTSHDSDGNGYGRRLTDDVIDHMRTYGAFN